MKLPLFSPHRVRMYHLPGTWCVMTLRGPPSRAAHLNLDVQSFTGVLPVGVIDWVTGPAVDNTVDY